MGVLAGWVRKALCSLYGVACPLPDLSIRIARRRAVRLLRRSNWDLFVHHGSSILRELGENDPRVQEFAQIYHFYVLPGGRGHDERMVEAFFGGRPFDQEVRRHADGTTYNAVLELGGTLSYYRQDNDSVVVFLHPPSARNVDRRQRFYVIDVIRKGTALTGSRKLEKHLKYLISMMEVRSLEGTPSLRDRFRVFRVERLKIRIDPPPDGEIMESVQPIQRYGRSATEIILLSGLSGWVFIVIPYLWYLFFGVPSIINM